MRQYELDWTGKNFTRNWFLNRNYNTFATKVLPAFAGIPTVYLELGVFEGMSMCWMLQHVLTHPDSRAVGVDPWLETTKLDGDFMERAMVLARENTRVAVYGTQTGGPSTTTSSGFSKCTLVRGCSAEILRKMQGRRGAYGIKSNSVDICMIDGDHNELAVMDDAANAVELVKPGGWLLFDDVENRIEKKHHVKQGLAAYLAMTPGRLNLLWKDGFVEAYEKVK